jgi:hypothetical protein
VGKLSSEGEASKENSGISLNIICCKDALLWSHLFFQENAFLKTKCSGRMHPLEIHTMNLFFSMDLNKKQNTIFYINIV